MELRIKRVRINRCRPVSFKLLQQLSEDYVIVSKNDVIDAKWDEKVLLAVVKQLGELLYWSMKHISLYLWEILNHKEHITC